MDHPFLYSLFIQLKAKGLPLGTRDFLEGLEAIPLYQSRFIQLREILEKKYSGQHNTDIAGLPMQTRLALTWLCQTLWARSQQERDIVSQVINHDINLADNDIIFKALQLFRNPTTKSSIAYHFEEPDTFSSKNTNDDSASSQQHNENEHQQTKTYLKNTQNSVSKKHNHITTKNEQGKTAVVGVDKQSPISSSDDQSTFKFSIPELGNIPLIKEKTFNWNNQPELSQLWMLALWRRLYKPTKQIDRYQVDIDKTVEQLCQDGVLLSPSMSDRSYNTAELLLLIDRSEYMAPWQATSGLLCETAMSKLSRLKEAHVYYFNKMPGQYVYEDPDLNTPINIEKVFLKTRKAVIIIFSEAGAAANEFDALRQRRSSQFFEYSSLQSGRKIVWLNPMPNHHWPDLFLDLLNKHPRIKACPLTANALLQAVQYLRED